MGIPRAEGERRRRLNAGCEQVGAGLENQPHTAKRSTAFKDSNKATDVKRNLDFWPDEWFPHKHLRPAIDVKKSKFPQGGWIVRANRPHGHLVEYGHYLVTPDGRTIGFVPPHAFLRPAKEEVMAGLGRMEL